MVNEKDFIYEYSDLNLFQNRVKVLTGPYADLILEYGHSHIEQCADQIKFDFDYQLYDVPDNIKGIAVKGDKDFESFLTDLLLSVIECRRDDPAEHDKLMQAASAEGFRDSRIKISDSFYNKPENTIAAKGLQEF